MRTLVRYSSFVYKKNSPIPPLCVGLKSEAVFLARGVNSKANFDLPYNSPPSSFTEQGDPLEKNRILRVANKYFATCCFVRNYVDATIRVAFSELNSMGIPSTLKTIDTLPNAFSTTLHPLQCR